MLSLEWLQRGAHRARWLPDGARAVNAVLEAIDAARQSVCFEVYIIRPEGPGEALRNALLAAVQRGVQVRLLYDAFGSEALPAGFFDELRAAGGDVRVFSPARRLRLAMRDHRKLLICDDSTAIVGGFNIGPEYCGDGISEGWFDLGLQIGGPLVQDLRRGFDAMFALAPLSTRALYAFRRAVDGPEPALREISLLQRGLGWPSGRLRRALNRDLRSGRQVHCVAAYFLPSSRIRRELANCHRRGGRVQLLLAGLSDVPISKFASEHLYTRLMRAGVEVWEYQPQILHAKLLIIDDLVYVGSCNLDRRGLYINYELLLRLEWPELAAQGRQLFDAALAHSRQLDHAEWRRRSWWQRWRAMFAYWLVSRADPLVARRAMRSLD